MRRIHQLGNNLVLSRFRLCKREFSISQDAKVETKLSHYTKKIINGIRSGDRVSLSRAITLVESTKKEHQEQAELLLDNVLETCPISPKHEANPMQEELIMDSPEKNFINKKQENHIENGETLQPRSSFRLGIAGPPGAGKSTFIEALGLHLIKNGHKVTVLAIDPSSSRTGGSILGDKTRMTYLSREDNAYVRPSPTRGTLGGVAQHTNDVVMLCEAAGYDIILVESVGIGQSETVVDDTVDMTMLLVPPGGGDELQGSKKGIMEVVDMIVVNKADGDMKNSAKHTAVEYKHAVQLMRNKTQFWKPPVKLCSALENSGIEKVWESVCEYRRIMDDNGQITLKRNRQSFQWMWTDVQEEIMRMVRNDPSLHAIAAKLSKNLVEGRMCPRSAAKKLVQEFVVSKK